MADIGYGFLEGPFPGDHPGPQVVENVYTFIPVTDDTGSVNFGNGTTDMDVKVFLGDTSNYALFDVGNGRFHLERSTVGGDSPKGMSLDCEVLAGKGFRQAGLQISVNRASGEDFTWDGNPDCGLKIITTNRAANASAEGAARGIDVQARNRGTNMSWCNSANFNARTDSGTTCATLTGIEVRIESYGTITTAVGLNVNMSVEGASTTKTGILIRNTDASGMSAVRDVFMVSHTSTNGFTNLFYFNGTTGDTVSAGSLTDSGTNDVACDYRITCSINGTAYYIPLFDSAA